MLEDVVVSFRVKSPAGGEVVFHERLSPHEVWALTARIGGHHAPELSLTWFGSIVLGAFAASCGAVLLGAP